MRKLLHQEFLCELLVAVAIYAAQDHAFQLGVCPLVLQIFYFLAPKLLYPLSSLVEASFVYAIACPLVPATSYFWCFYFLAELICNLFVLCLLKFIYCFLLILGDEEILKSLVLCCERDDLLLLSLESFQILLDIEGHFHCLLSNLGLCRCLNHLRGISVPGELKGSLLELIFVHSRDREGLFAELRLSRYEWLLFSIRANLSLTNLLD
jgi:hypothetical protein